MRSAFRRSALAQVPEALVVACAPRPLPMPDAFPRMDYRDAPWRTEE
jgi:hypothetical protein